MTVRYPCPVCQAEAEMVFVEFSHPSQGLEHCPVLRCPSCDDFIGGSLGEAFDAIHFCWRCHAPIRSGQSVVRFPVGDKTYIQNSLWCNLREKLTGQDVALFEGTHLVYHKECFELSPAVPSAWQRLRGWCRAVLAGGTVHSARDVAVSASRPAGWPSGIVVMRGGSRPGVYLICPKTRCERRILWGQHATGGAIDPALSKITLGTYDCENMFSAPVLSPNGRFVAVRERLACPNWFTTSSPELRWRISAWDRADGRLIPLLTETEKRAGLPTEMAWSPDGQTLAIGTWWKETSAYRLRVFSLVHGASQELGEGDQPRYHPDGRLTATRDHRVWLVTGAGQWQEMPGLRQGLVEATWSPDGQWCAAAEYSSPRAAIRLLHSGGEERIVGEGLNPTWSPDGTQLAFSAIDEGFCRGLRLYDLASGETRILTQRPLNADSGDDHYPRWAG